MEWEKKRMKLKKKQIQNELNKNIKIMITKSNRQEKIKGEWICKQNKIL
jgi:hypothetical protein